MAASNPKGDGSAIVLSIAFRDHPFLLHTLTAARDGLREELDRLADQLRESTSVLLREEAAYDKLIDGLSGEPIHPDVDIRDAVRGIADSIDHENEYHRVVAEHDALWCLLKQVEEGSRR